ncbi:MAG: tetratricopeptide repeat protein, partial [Caulobacteraceae bacterium]
VAYRRSATVLGNVLRVVASQRSLQAEISAAEARDSVGPLTKLGEAGVYAPAGHLAQAANDAAALDSNPTTVGGHLDRGSALLNAARFKEALAEYDAAIALDPKSQMAWAGRAVAHAWLADPTAIADADKADALGGPVIAAARARALLAEKTGDLEGARAAYLHALTLAPNDAFALGHLIAIELRSANIEVARKDLDQLLQSHPELAGGAHLWRAAIELAAHHKEAAERELAQASVATPEALLDRARAFLQLGDKDLARADLDAAIRLKPSAAAWLLRASADGGFASALANADVEAAIKLAPDDLDAQLWKVNAATSRHEFAAALPLMNRVVNEHPEAAGNLLVGRAQIEAELGLRAEMDADFVRAQATVGPSAPQSSVLCAGEVRARWRPQTALEDCEKNLLEAPKSFALHLDKAVLLHRLGREAEAARTLDAMEGAAPDPAELNQICYLLAVEDMALDRALADCEASLKLRPGDAATLDSRAFVLMRLGRNAEALTAYNAALAADPKEYNSLYGRGLVEARLGRMNDSRRDTTAALAGRPHLGDDFAKMGLR